VWRPGVTGAVTTLAWTDCELKDRSNTKSVYGKKSVLDEIE